MASSSRLLLAALLCALAPALYGRTLHATAAGPHHTGSAAGEQDRWVVVLDAGSSGTRVAVYEFAAPSAGANVTQTDLDYFAYEKTKPGLSSYAGKPAQAAASLKPLLDAALAAIPADKQASTTLMLGATAGLRFLPLKQENEILAAVRKYIRHNTPFQFRDRDIRVLSGAAEGAYAWAQTNYLVDRLGLKPSQTLAVLDMGGGSMQESFAMSKKGAAKIPANSTEVIQIDGKGTLPNYHLYSHSYLGFGSKAARGAILAQGSPDGSPESPCVPLGANETYLYDGVEYQVLPLPGGPQTASCASAAMRAIATHKPCGATQSECTFQGAWGGSRVPSDVVLISTFWWTALEGGLVNATADAGVVTPRDYGALAERACSLAVEDYPEAFPELAEESYPFFCLDASYIHTVLTQGFKFGEDQPLHVVNSISYDKPSGRVPEAQEVSMSWTLGAALATLMGWTATAA